MTYRIDGLDPRQFSQLFGLTDEELAVHGARRVFAEGSAYPCRVTLENAQSGKSLLLLNHVSLDVPTPFRSSFAIYVQEGAAEAAMFIDEPAPVMRDRTLSLRGFSADGMLVDARISLPGDADAEIRGLFTNPEIVEIHAHNAAQGCFAARIVRH